VKGLGFILPTDMMTQSDDILSAEIENGRLCSIFAINLWDSVGRFYYIAISTFCWQNLLKSALQNLLLRMWIYF